MKIAGYTKSGRGVNTDQPETDTKRSPKKDKLDKQEPREKNSIFRSVLIYLFL